MIRTVLSVAYPLTQVGPDAVGGSEQVLTMLDHALTEAGYRSLVIAAEGSRITGTLIASPGAINRLDDAARRRGQQDHRELIRETLDRFSVDLVHMHSLDFHCYLPDGDLPVLATLHLPPDWYPRCIFNSRRRHFYLNCVSSSQRRECPASRTPIFTVPNGIDVTRFGGRATKTGSRLPWEEGRICPEKGFDLALDACRIARTPLLLAGEIFPYELHRKHFVREIAPRLGGGCRFLGPVEFLRKRQMLARARCLLVPSRVQETSSLVAMEALASGTPVIAFPSGALPEIIEHGRTGFLVTNTAEMAAAILRAHEIDPRTCRDAALTRFSGDDMIRRYLDLYDRMAAKKASEEDEVRVRPGTSWLVNW